MTEEDGGSQAIPYGSVSAPFPAIPVMAFAPPLPDGSLANSPARREVLRNLSGDFIESHPVDAGYDESLQLGIASDLGRRARPMFAAVFADRC